MKIFLWVLLLFPLAVIGQKGKTENIIFISVDGYRWEELFRGIDTSLSNKKHYLRTDSAAVMRKYWAATQEERREKLMPFFWSTIAQKGQLYGNRDLGNFVNMRNTFWFSYPGRSETITGYFDPKINSNGYPDNPNTNVFEFINQQKGYKGKVATFASWNAVAQIVNRNRNKMPLFIPYEKVTGRGLTEAQQLANEIQDFIPKEFGQGGRWDMTTYAIAKTYIAANHPKVVYIDFADVDELGHRGRYDDYLDAAHYTDQMIGSLWDMVQRDPFYKDKTTFVICTDHGRGSGADWTSHTSSIKGSGDTWLAVIGPDTPPLGEVSGSNQIYQDQFAQTMAHLLGFEFKAEHPIGERIKTISNK